MKKRSARSSRFSSFLNKTENSVESDKGKKGGNNVARNRGRFDVEEFHSPQDNNTPFSPIHEL